MSHSSHDIMWLKDNSKIIHQIAESIFALQERISIISDLLKNILAKFKELIEKISATMESKQITFHHLRILDDHYQTYQTVYKSTAMFIKSDSEAMCLMITKEEIKKAIDCASKILNQLIMKPAHDQCPQLADEGYVNHEC